MTAVCSKLRSHPDIAHTLCRSLGVLFFLCKDDYGYIGMAVLLDYRLTMFVLYYNSYCRQPWQQ